MAPDPDSSHEPLSCQCSCGQTRFQVQGRPLLRFYCHCRICQAFNQAPFADVTVFVKRSLRLPPGLNIQYRAHRPPPHVQRGICPQCQRPALELLELGPLPGLAIIPSANFDIPSPLPAPELHIFYHRRQSDAHDSLPKYQGYWSSQAALGRYLFKASRR